MTHVFNGFKKVISDVEESMSVFPSKPQTQLRLGTQRERERERERGMGLGIQEESEKLGSRGTKQQLMADYLLTTALYQVS